MPTTRKRIRDRKGYVPPSRRATNTKMIAGHFPPSLHDAMRAVADKVGKSLQQAMAEAFEEYVEKHMPEMNLEQPAQPAEQSAEPTRPKSPRPTNRSTPPKTGP